MRLPELLQLMVDLRCTILHACQLFHQLVVALSLLDHFILCESQLLFQTNDLCLELVHCRLFAKKLIDLWLILH
jgi:hypothetical protein